MQDYLIYELLKDELRIQDKALRKLIWLFNKIFYSECDFKQNILLIGKRGSGKTTMLKKVAELMEIPMGEVYNMFGMDGYNGDLFVNGIYQMMNDSSDGRGILLLHDFQNNFIYDTSDGFNSMIASGIMQIGDGAFYNTSNITIVGEIDTNNVTDLFPKDRDYLADFENYRFMSPTLNLLYDYISDDNKIYVNENNNKVASLGLEKYVAGRIRSSFLSTCTQNAFGEKIYMDDMNMEIILSALKSPLSDLNLYRDDLSKDYLLSDAFVKEIAYQIMESGEGLHYVRKAALDTIFRDIKYNNKILKKDFLFSVNKK